MNIGRLAIASALGELSSEHVVFIILVIYYSFNVDSFRLCDLMYNLLRYYKNLQVLLKSVMV